MLKTMQAFQGVLKHSFQNALRISTRSEKNALQISEHSEISRHAENRCAFQGVLIVFNALQISTRSEIYNMHYRFQNILKLLF